MSAVPIDEEVDVLKILDDPVSVFACGIVNSNEDNHSFSMAYKLSLSLEVTPLMNS